MSDKETLILNTINSISKRSDQNIYSFTQYLC